MSYFTSRLQAREAGEKDCNTLVEVNDKYDTTKYRRLALIRVVEAIEAQQKERN